jgi:hypothetical protein
MGNSSLIFLSHARARANFICPQSKSSHSLARRNDFAQSIIRPLFSFLLRRRRTDKWKSPSLLFLCSSFNGLTRNAQETRPKIWREGFRTDQIPSEDAARRRRRDAGPRDGVRTRLGEPFLSTTSFKTMPRLRKASQPSEACALEKDGTASQDAPDILLPTKSIRRSDDDGFDENDKENICSSNNNGQTEKKSRGKGRAKATTSAAADMVAATSTPAKDVEKDGESHTLEVALDASGRHSDKEMPAPADTSSSTSTARIGRPSMAGMAAMPVRQRKLMFMEAAKSGTAAMDLGPTGGRGFQKQHLGQHQHSNKPKTAIQTTATKSASSSEASTVVATHDDEPSTVVIHDDERSSSEAVRSPSSYAVGVMSIASAMSMLQSATIATDLRSTGICVF